MMKKNVKNIAITLTVMALMGVVFTSCNSKKNIASATQSQEIELPFSEKDYQTNDKYFRAKNMGESKNLATSKKIALVNAKSEMASNIQSTVKAVTDQYINQYEVSDKQSYESKFEELTRIVVNQTLNDVRTIGEKTFQNKNSNIFTYWIAIEMSKEELLKKLESAVASDEKLQVDFDKYQFEKIFNEEMEKFKNQ